MRIPRTLSALVAALALLAAGTVLSPAASAADLDGCSVGTSVSFYEGATVVFTDTATCSVDSLSPTAGRVVDTFIPTPRGYSFLNTWPTAGEAIGTIDFMDLNIPGLVTVTLYSLGPAPTPADPAASDPIPDWLQAYGVFTADAKCETGWSNSWQEWAVPITGGWVCTRVIPSLG